MTNKTIKVTEEVHAYLMNRRTVELMTPNAIIEKLIELEITTCAHVTEVPVRQAGEEIK